MKQVEINEIMFEKAIKAVKNSIGRDEARPMLRYIRIVVGDGSVTFYTLDGFRASKFKITADTPDSFEAFLPAVKFKATKNGVENVVIGVEDDITVLKITNELGKTTHKFNNPSGSMVFVEKIFSDAAPHDRELGFNAHYVAQALKGIAAVSLDRYRLAILETNQDNTKPFLIKAAHCEDSGIEEYTQLILPIRLSGNE